MLVEKGMGIRAGGLKYTPIQNPWPDKIQGPARYACQPADIPLRTPKSSIGSSSSLTHTINGSSSLCSALEFCSSGCVVLGFCPKWAGATGLRYSDELINGREKLYDYFKYTKIIWNLD